MKIETEDKIETKFMNGVFPLNTETHFLTQRLN